MEPKLEELIEPELKGLERSVYGYLQFQLELASADDIKRREMLEDNIEIPDVYLLVRKLKVFAGPNGGLPFLLEGGYMDQPYITTLAIEACVLGERQFQAFLNQEKDGKSTR